ncbi:MAG: molybdenum cofactor guanylyltransferase MobA [Bauldia sp.]
MVLTPFGPIAGLVLAGGAARRLGGDKALRPLLGKPLVRHVIERVEPQVERLWISVRGEAGGLRTLGYRCIDDASGDGEGNGPLAGIVAGLAAAAAEGVAALAVVPCDTPFLPLDLVARLSEALSASQAPAAIVRSGGRLQPTVGLWRSSSRQRLAEHLAAGRRKLERVCADLGAAVVDAAAAGWTSRAFANLNTPADFADAEKMAV